MNIQQKSIITLGSCNPIQDTTIIQCTSEEQLIKEFESIIKTENPDIVTGYNILGFDFPYIVNRAKQKHLIIKLVLISYKSWVIVSTTKVCVV